MQNLSREQIDDCCLWINERLQDHQIGIGNEGRRVVVSIALKQHAKGLRRMEWRRVVEQEFLGRQPDVANPLLIIGAIQILLTLIRIWIELRDKPAV